MPLVYSLLTAIHTHRSFAYASRNVVYLYWKFQNGILQLCASLKPEMHIWQCWTGRMTLMFCSAHVFSELHFFWYMVWPILFVAVWEFHTWIRKKFMACVQDRLKYTLKIFLHSRPKCKMNLIKISPSQLNLSSLVKKGVVEWLLEDLTV